VCYARQEGGGDVQYPAVKQRFVADGAEPVGGTPEEFAAVIRADLEKWGKVITNAGIRLR
jgi:tripartite-type tricarboxylate transporter receptor subunit TctC